MDGEEPLERSELMEVMKAERSYYDVNEVMEMLGCKQDKAYKIMRAIKKELIKDGKLIADYPAGKVPKKYFDERCCIAH